MREGMRVSQEFKFWSQWFEFSLSCWPRNLDGKTVVVTCRDEFVSTEVWIAIKMELFKGKKPPIFYHRFKKCSLLDPLETLRTR